jgi:hypothetical protein
VWKGQARLFSVLLARLKMSPAKKYSDVRIETRHRFRQLDWMGSGFWLMGSLGILMWLDRAARARALSVLVSKSDTTGNNCSLSSSQESPWTLDLLSLSPLDRGRYIR